MFALVEPDQAERLLAPMRTFGRPLIDLGKRSPYTAVQSMLDATVPPGWHYYWKSTGLKQLDDTVIETMVNHAARGRSPWSYTVLFDLGGAVAEVDPDATAYSRRDVAYELNINAVWLPHESVGDDETAWARAFAADLEPHDAGVYVNFLDHDDQYRTAIAFGAAAYARLIELRRRFDPDRVFQPHRETASVPTRA